MKQKKLKIKMEQKKFEIKLEHRSVSKMFFNGSFLF